MSLAAGDPAPTFTLKDQHGADVAVGGRAPDGRATLVVFYPFAFSGVCGSELAALRDAGAELGGGGAVGDGSAVGDGGPGGGSADGGGGGLGPRVRLVAVSCDPMHALRGYADQEGFGFPLLSDFWPHGAAARAYGVFDEARGCAGRGSFLIDPDGLVRWSLIHPITEARPLSAYRAALAGVAEAAD